METKLSQITFIYQEVMPGGAGNPPAYEARGDVLEFTYGKKLKEQFGGSIANLQTFGQTWGLEPAAATVTFVDNHDTDRNGSTLTSKSGSAYTLANVFHLAWGYGKAQVYSSFAFSTNDQAPPRTAVDSSRTRTARRQPGPVQTAARRSSAWSAGTMPSPEARWRTGGATGNAISFSRGTSGLVCHVVAPTEHDVPIQVHQEEPGRLSHLGSDPNRSYTTGPIGAATVNESWR